MLLHVGEPLQIRHATHDDLDDILWIVTDGYPDDPGCDYKYPQRNKYPEDFEKWTRKEYKDYLKRSRKFVFLVVTAPTSGGAEESTPRHKPIALGIWDIAALADSKGTLLPHAIPTAVPDTIADVWPPSRRDMSFPHVRMYNDTLIRGFKKHFLKYGSRQMHLWLLITHPDWRRRGAGTMLCNWGLKESNKRGNWPLTVMASPMGKPFYEHLGYELRGTETARVKGEEEKVDIWFLVKTEKE